jgi:hypothetical protein
MGAMILNAGTFRGFPRLKPFAARFWACGFASIDAMCDGVVERELSRVAISRGNRRRWIRCGYEPCLP